VDKTNLSINNEAVETHPESGQNSNDSRGAKGISFVSIPGQPQEDRVYKKSYPGKRNAESE